MTEHTCLSFEEIEKYTNMPETEDWTFISGVVERLENCENCESRFSRYMLATGFWNKYIDMPSEDSLPQRMAVLVRENIDKAKKYGERFVETAESFLSGTASILSHGGTFLPAPALATRGQAASVNLLKKVTFDADDEHLISAESSGKGKLSFNNPEGIHKACAMIWTDDGNFFEFYELVANEDKLICVIDIPAAGTYRLAVISL